MSLNRKMEIINVNRTCPLTLVVILPLRFWIINSKIHRSGNVFFSFVIKQNVRGALCNLEGALDGTTVVVVLVALVVSVGGGLCFTGTEELDGRVTEFLSYGMDGM